MLARGLERMEPKIGIGSPETRRMERNMIVAVGRSGKYFKCFETTAVLLSSITPVYLDHVSIDPSWIGAVEFGNHRFQIHLQKVWWHIGVGMTTLTGFRMCQPKLRS